VIGEWNLVEVIAGVVVVEGSKSAIARLHADQPVSGDLHGASVARPRRRLIHRPSHHGGVVEVWIVRVGILKRPSAASQAGVGIAPVARLIGNLPLGQPVQRATDGIVEPGLLCGLPLCRLQGKTGQAGVPHRRNARLAIGDVVLFDEKLVDRFSRSDQQRVICRVSEQAQGQIGIHHGRKDRAQAVLAIEPLGDPGLRAAQRLAPDKARHQRIEHQPRTSLQP